MSLLLVDHASPYADAPMSLWLKLIEIILLSEGSVSIASHFQSFFILFAFPIPGPKLSQIPALSSLAETREADTLPSGIIIVAFSSSAYTDCAIANCIAITTNATANNLYICICSFMLSSLHKLVH